MFSVFDFNLQHHKIFLVWAFRLSGNHVNFKFFRLNQQEENNTLSTWTTSTNDRIPYSRIKWFVMLFKTGFVFPASWNGNTNILCVFCIDKRIVLLITDYKVSLSFTLHTWFATNHNDRLQVFLFCPHYIPSHHLTWHVQFRVQAVPCKISWKI